MKTMIKFLALAFFCCIWGAVNAQKPNDGEVWMFSYFKGNGEDGLHFAYSTDGLKWEALNDDKSFLTPTAGKDKLMRDPCIIRGADGLFHMVWTVSWNEQGLGYASSKDLVNWSEQQYIPVMEYEPTALNTWAPEVTYDAKKKEYMIYWASTIPGRYPMKGMKPEGKYNHQMYYVTTKDFKKFSKTKMLYYKDFCVIDATILKDGKRWVMFLKDEGDMPAQKNLRIAYAKKLTGPYSEAGKPITGKYWAEGPTVLKSGNEWFVFFDKYIDKKYGAVKSTDLENWTDISDEISMPKGMRHGTIFSITNQEFEQLQQKIKK